MQAPTRSNYSHYQRRSGSKALGLFPMNSPIVNRVDMTARNGSWHGSIVVAVVAVDVVAVAVVAVVAVAVVVVAVVVEGGDAGGNAAAASGDAAEAVVGAEGPKRQNGAVGLA